MQGKYAKARHMQERHVGEWNGVSANASSINTLDEWSQSNALPQGKESRMKSESLIETIQGLVSCVYVAIDLSSYSCRDLS